MMPCVLLADVNIGFFKEEIHANNPHKCTVRITDITSRTVAVKYYLAFISRSDTPAGCTLYMAYISKLSELHRR